MECHNQLVTSHAVKTEEVGKKNPIVLPVMDLSDIFETIGDKIAQGGFGCVFQVKESHPSRVYKVISRDEFENGDEIRFLESAAQAGVAPTFHRAFLAKNNQDACVFIEMDHAGQSLGKWTEKLAEKDIPEAQSGHQSKWTVREIKRVSLEEAVEKLFGTQEMFYYELFSKVKILAEQKIVYSDSHIGNLMIKSESKNCLQLIDFGSAEQKNTVCSAVRETMGKVYMYLHYQKFAALSNLSQESEDLIKWFREQSQLALKEVQEKT